MGSLDLQTRLEETLFCLIHLFYQLKLQIVLKLSQKVLFALIDYYEMFLEVVFIILKCCKNAQQNFFVYLPPLVC